MPRKRNPVQIGEGTCLFCGAQSLVFINTRHDLYQRCVPCGKCDQRHDPVSQAAILAGLRARGFEPPFPVRKLIDVPPDDVDALAGVAVDTLGAAPAVPQVQQQVPKSVPDSVPEKNNGVLVISAAALAVVLSGLAMIFSGSAGAGSNFPR